MSLSRTIAQTIVKNEIPAKKVEEVLETYGLLSLLPTIVDEVKRLTEYQKGSEAIAIESPFPLSKVAEQKIKRIVGNDLAETVITINPDLLAGFKARWHGKLYDGSAERIIKQLINHHL